MIHVESSIITERRTKEQTYRRLLEHVTVLIKDQRNWVCNLANTASLLWYAYASQPPPLSSVNWTGFYVLDPLKPHQLILGPFMGKVACQTIHLNQGVCGKSAMDKKSIVVDDVESFPSHVRCDDDTQSEIVVPIFGRNDEVVAVIDIDSREKMSFDDVDKIWLEKLAMILGEGCDW